MIKGTLQRTIVGFQHFSNHDEFLVTNIYRFQTMGYKYESAVAIMDRWVKEIDFIGGGDPQVNVAEFPDHITVSYRNFSANISRKNAIIYETPEIICKSAMFEVQRIENVPGFVKFDDRIRDILRAYNVIEVSRTLATKILTASDFKNYRLYTHLTTPGCGQLSELTPDDTHNCVIVANRQHLPYFHSWLKKYHRGVLISVEPIESDYIPVTNSFTVSTPIVSSAMDGSQPKFWADITRYFVNGPPEMTRTITDAIKLTFGADYKP